MVFLEGKGLRVQVDSRERRRKSSLRVRARRCSLIVMKDRKCKLIDSEEGGSEVLGEPLYCRRF